MCEHIHLSKHQAESLLDVLKNLTEEIGGCDHQVGVCCCHLYQLQLMLKEKINGAMFKKQHGIPT